VLEKVQETLADLVNRVTSVSDEMQNFRKQMEDYGTDLDGIKRKLADGGRVEGQSRVEITRHAPGAFTNNGGPLLDLPPSSSAVGNLGFHTAPSSPHEREDLRIRAPRHDIPKFRGQTPLLWIDQCLTYFDMFKIARH
jgi:hypothetical protein